MQIIRAAYVTYQREGSIISVGFADDEFNTHSYVLLQRETEPTPQDVKLGQDNIHIEVDSPLKSTYGGVSQIEFNANELKILLEESASQQLGVSRIEIDYSESKQDLKDLRSHLIALVGSKSVFKELT